jgi:ABC-type transport system involved in cytochrome c biogenesis permease component
MIFNILLTHLAGTPLITAMGKLLDTIAATPREEALVSVIK